MKEDKKEFQIELRSEEFQEVLGDSPSWILRWGIVLLSLIFLILLIGSFIFKYPEIISAEMTLTSFTPPAEIKAKSTGKLQELYVVDNEMVKQGKYLAVIENSAVTKDILQLKEYLSSYNNDDTILSLPPKELNLGNMQTLYSSFYITVGEFLDFMYLDYFPQKKTALSTQIDNYQLYFSSLKNQKKIVEEQLKIKKDQYQRDSTLYKKGIIAYEELEFTKDSYLQAHLSLENIQSTIENTKIEMLQMKEGLLDIEKQYVERKTSLEMQIETYIRQLFAEIQSWEMNYVFAAPINGKVIFTTIWTKNQNITTGQNVFNIVPEESGTLMGKALLPMSRSGKVKLGQKVNIRFNNFPDSEFGVVKGTVENISLIPTSDDNKTFYTIDIKLAKGLLTSYDRELPYLPEMVAQIDIITNDLSLFERLIMPVRKIITENI